jgi:hypothetical protein
MEREYVTPIVTEVTPPRHRITPDTFLDGLEANVVRNPCIEQCEDCPLPEKRRRTVGHHLYYYASLYETQLEKAFRNSFIEQRCICVEIADPHRNPLPKPSLEEMIVAMTVKFDQENGDENSVL